jgi:V/A-type H+-transporting ATPase subunit I
MLIGDAGIGVIFIILTAFAQFKFGKKTKSKSIYYLFYMLSLCAIIWGLLTGTIFGQEWLGASFKPLVPALRNDRNIQALCFLIGAIHLSIAHIWRAILKAPSAACLADIGWTLILWGGFFLARLLVLGESFPVFGPWLFGAGAILVLLFTAPNKNMLKGIGEGAGALALNFVNSFTDVVSYIRLFAVGLATVAVADAFNKMAMDVGFGNIFSGIVTAIILIIGQALNVVLGPMSVLVHGVRLNVLEFSSHVDIKWSGFRYNPLKEK